jgi:hypothetical protein
MSCPMPASAGEIAHQDMLVSALYRGVRAIPERNERENAAAKMNWLEGHVYSSGLEQLRAWIADGR